MGDGCHRVRLPLRLDSGAQVGVSLLPNIRGKGRHVPGRINQFQDARDDEAQIFLGIGGWRQHGELAKNKKSQVCSTNFLSQRPVKYY